MVREGEGKGRDEEEEVVAVTNGFWGGAKIGYISQYTSFKNKRKSCQITNLILLSEGRNQIALSRIQTYDP